ncbi:hypothetical protein [Melissococcus plutonius]|uniref:hypothetical protein n=2 Tax=Melissococcus plutonius TaxID=33970 RepID=UPI0021E59292|nr:hypothetical protein [Melissococcus plutonius]
MIRPLSEMEINNNGQLFVIYFAVASILLIAMIPIIYSNRFDKLHDIFYRLRRMFSIKK